MKSQGALIRYPKFNELHSDIQLCQELTTQAGEPACMALQGVTGAGKSTLVEAYADNFPRYEAEDGTRIPVLYLGTPSSVTVKGMAVHMLTALGDPGSHKWETLHSLNARLILFLKKCEVQLVILDDFHHLIDSETNKILARVSDWLKVLIKETGIPFLVVGIDNRIDTILQANQQLSRLFAVRETLEPLSLDNEEEARKFAHFLTYAQEAIGMEIVDDIPRPEMLARMYYATNGVVGNIIGLLQLASILAKKQGKSELSLLVLNEAFNKRLLERTRKQQNPFTEEISDLLPAELCSRIDGVGVRSQKRKKRKPSIASTLSTK